MSENIRKPATLQFVASSKFKMPLLFWLAMLVIIAVLMTASSYLVTQNQNRVIYNAELSTTSLASFVSDHLEKHKSLVKSVINHNKRRILELSKGSGYPYDLDEIHNDLKQLFPDNTEFAIVNHRGRVVVGSQIDEMSPHCKNLIKQSMGSITSAEPMIRSHASYDGGYHFDILYPIIMADDIAGFWVKLSFNSLELFMVNLNIHEYQLVVSEQVPPFNILLGGNSTQNNWMSFGGFGSMPSNNLIPNKETIAVEPIKGVAWQVRALISSDVFDEYERKVVLGAILVFFVIFVLSAALVLVFRQVLQQKEKYKQDAYHDELFNAGPTVLLEKNIDLTMSILYASPNAKSLLGLRSDELVNQSFLDWILPDDVNDVRKQLLLAYKEKRSKVEMVYRIMCDDNGGFKWIYDFTLIQYNQSGLPSILQGYITSIHAQKTAEKNATELIQSVPEAIFVTEPEGKIVKLNDAAESLLGCQKTDLDNSQFSHWLDDSSVAEYEKMKQRFLEEDYLAIEGRYITLDSLVLLNAQKRKISVEISFNQIELNGHEFLVQVVRDVTLQKQTQQHLNRAKDEAEALARARSRFMATISHEIRTPMNGVLGMTDLLSDTALTTQQSQYLEAIKQSGDMLLQTINEVLDFAKLNEGQVTLVQEPFDLMNLLETTVHLLSTQAEDKNTQLSLEYVPKTPREYVGDSRRIQQLLLNLIGNAIKFTEDGLVNVKVETISEQQNQAGQLTLSVIDTGIGIAEENLGRLFDSFAQADDSTSRQFGGTGLGLAICKQLVELMGGEIEVHSVLGKGTTFWVTLPLPAVFKPQLMESIEVVPEKSLSSGCGELPMQNCPVLVIEDNEINQNVIEAFLTRLGASVDVAENGLKGVDYWRLNSHKYQMILMDCQMPVMDGFEATRIIRKEETLMNIENAIPIIALTANVVAEDREQCLQVGMNDFLAKPFKRESFDAMMLSWCCRDD